jgi:hypothetical protein
MNALSPVVSALLGACPFLAATGLACPGCGTTRALRALLHGEVAAAFAFNPLLFVLGPLTAAVLTLSLLRIDNDRSARARTVLLWLIPAIVIAFWVWRNLPGYPLVQVP